MAPWKTIAMPFQRTSRRMASSDSDAMSLPSKQICPPTTRPFLGSRRISASARLLLPLPDSPTIPSASPPRSSANEIPSTAWTAPSCAVVADPQVLDLQQFPPGLASSAI